MNLITRLLVAIGIIALIGGAIMLLGLNNLNVCDDADLTQNLIESPWTLEGGRQTIQFNEDGTFKLNRTFSNDGVTQYKGTYRLLDDCHFSSPQAHRSSTLHDVRVRNIEVTFLTDGELSRSTGKSLTIEFTSIRHNTLNLHGTTYYKEWDFPQLTKSK